MDAHVELGAELSRLDYGSGMACLVVSEPAVTPNKLECWHTVMEKVEASVDPNATVQKLRCCFTHRDVICS